MIQDNSPLHALQRGQWFKLICGASYQHLPTIRNLAIAYGLVGADCIDIAADPAVVWQVRAALQVVNELTLEAQQRGFSPNPQPWLMVSLNDDDDPHFRKATFDARTCPPDCSRPCESICPAHAIAFPVDQVQAGGVIDQRCYGCGRCLPICPLQKITTLAYRSSPTAIAPLITAGMVQAIEIHTQVGHHAAFERLWNTLSPSLPNLRVLAVSCPDAEGFVPYLQELYEIMAPLPCELIWQTDGRSMSGDIGKGTTHTAIQAGQKVLNANLPGFVQVAGGTNHYTVAKLQALGLLNPQRSIQGKSRSHLAGIAYGSYARTLLQPVLESLEANPNRSSQLEDNPDLLWSTVALANQLVAPLKGGEIAIAVH